MSNETGLPQSLNGKLHQLFWFLLLVFVVLSCFRPMMDNVDIGWHVAQGRWMIEHGSFYRHDAFNYPNLDHSVIDEYPLFQVALYSFWKLGWWGPCLFSALAYGLLFYLLLKAASSFDLRGSALMVMGVGLALLFLQVAFTLRPHIATYLGLVMVGIFLLRHRDATNWTVFWPMALLQVAWVNSHSGFILEPILVGLFGTEMVVRRWIKERRFPWLTIRVWLGAFLLIVLAGFVNPYGPARLYLPFYHEQLESLRAYVGEMTPLSGTTAVLYGYQALAAFVVILLAVFFRRGAVSYSFLLLAILFYVEALSARKHWSIFGLLIPLIILSSGAFSIPATSRKPSPWLSTAGHFFVVIFVMVGIVARFDKTSGTNLTVLWHEFDEGRSEMSLKAVAWMKAHRLDGRLFHRCEDGGLLQQEGYDQGQTFADTGFGKYDPAFIHEVAMVGERPAMLPHYLQAYQPVYVVCGNFCHQWPYYLRKTNWRLIFYSPNSSVWTRPETNPDLPTVQDNEIMRAFDDDIAQNGMPSDLRLYGRNLIALDSMGLEDFAFTKLKALPAELHHAPWYWEAAAIMCFEVPKFTPEHRADLLQEAEQLHDDLLTAYFRANCHYEAFETALAQEILETVPPKQLDNNEAELLLKLYLAGQDPRALTLAHRTDCFDPRNGRHWQYLAEAEGRVGDYKATAEAWKKAVFYYPDSPTLMTRAAAFATKFHDTELSQAIEESSQVYGTR